MSKIKMLNDLKLHLTSKNIDFTHVIANKKIKINHLALTKSKIELEISCEKDEYGTYLKLHTNDDCMGMFESINDREYTDAVDCARRIKSAIKTQSFYWQL
jgi:hypothetical protein